MRNLKPLYIIVFHKVSFYLDCYLTSLLGKQELSFSQSYEEILAKIDTSLTELAVKVKIRLK